MKTTEAYDWKDMVIEAKEYFEDFDFDDFTEDFLDAYLEELNEEIGLELTKQEYDEVYDEIYDMLLAKKEEARSYEDIMEEMRDEYYEALMNEWRIERAFANKSNNWSVAF